MLTLTNNLGDFVESYRKKTFKSQKLKISSLLALARPRSLCAKAITEQTVRGLQQATTCKAQANLLIIRIVRSASSRFVLH